MLVKEEKINYLKDSNLAVHFISVKHYPPHFHHSVIEFIILIKGSITVVSNFETVILNEGDFFTIDQRDIHYLFSNDSENLVLSIHINLEPLFSKNETFEQNLFVFENYNKQEHYNTIIKQTLNRLMAVGYLYAAKKDMPKEHYNLLAENLAKTMNKYFSLLNFITEYKNLPEHKEEMIKKILTYIANNFMNKVSLSTMADHLHYNKSYLARFLKELTSFNFSKALNYYRCSEAEFLLLTTMLPNEEISIQCGFSGLRLFYENFKDWWGVTPYQHRQKYINYMKLQDGYKIIQPDKITDIFKDKYCGYHLKNELETIIDKYSCLTFPI